MQQNKLFSIVWPIVLAVLAVVLAVVIVNGQVNNKFNEADRSLTLWNIQPGLGTVMIEYATRMGNAWWSADAGNWDMTNYQLKEMTEIQEVGEATRPGHADALKAFEHKDLDPLIKAAKNQDMAAFTAAYDQAITGCNKCHGETKGKDGSNYRFVKIVRPASTAPFSNVDWQGQ
ncbi:MAG: hypothetical protein GXP38_09210 [Chloroflexi bacterium]|nr:hypothetical protein [Chloroflexota bacterium]